jgi:multidrug resistance protein
VAHTITVSIFLFNSHAISTIVAPSQKNIGLDLSIEQTSEQAMILSVFVAAYVIGPLFWAPLSEVHGRVMVTQISSTCLVLFNLACGLARSKSQMIAFRFLAGIGGSAPQVIGGGMISDLFAPELRGHATSVYSIAPLLGPVVGPIAGGWIVQRTTWRWIFYSTAISCGVLQIALLIFLQESYAPVLILRKKRKLMKDTQNSDLYTSFDHLDHSFLRALSLALTRPFRILGTQPIIQLLALYQAFLYGTNYLILSSFPMLWTERYHQSIARQSLNYISLGVGFALGAQLGAYLQDRMYAYLMQRYVHHSNQGRPEFRAPVIIPGALLIPLGLLVYSWTAEAHAHWIFPNIGAALYAAGAIIAFQSVRTYIVDAYPTFAASALSATIVLQSVAGFGFPLFAPTMYHALGFGKGGTLLAICSIAFGWPAPFFLWRFGASLRNKSAFAA